MVTGIGASIAAVMLCEYLARTRLLPAVGSWRISTVTAVLGTGFVAAAPLGLLDPQGLYTTLADSIHGV